MLDGVFNRIETAKLRWLGGGMAEAAGAEAQLRLLAEAALFGQSCLRPQLPSGLTLAAPIPALDLPVLPDPLRPVFRALMQQQDRSFWQGTIGLMAARGAMAHPFDWLPPQDLTGYPDVYIGLAKWRAGIATAGDLTAVAWADMYPAEQRQAFGALRARDPAAARDLMAAQAAALAAEERLAVLKCFSIGLSHADAEYLTALAANDRSAKVKAQAAAFLARLGATSTAAEAQELAAFLEQSTTGLIRRRKVITLRAKLADAQMKRALALFDLVSVADLAAALGTSLDALMQAYVTESQALALPFWQMCLRSAPDAALAIYWARMRADGVATVAALGELAERWPQDRIRAEAAELIKSLPELGFHEVLAVLGPDVGPELSAALLHSQGYRSRREALKAALAKRAKGETDYSITFAISQFEAAVSQLALMLTAQDAQKAARELQSMGLYAADPLLRVLNFNIALQGISL